MFSNTLTIQNQSFDLKILSDLSGKKLELSNPKLDSILHSFRTTGIDVSNFQLSDLFPNKQLFNDLVAERNEKLNFLFQEIKDPDVLSFYEQFRPFVQLLETKINGQKLKTDLTPNRISFNPTGSKDGRLSTKKAFLNIYSLAKEERCRIQSIPEYRFVQFDYRSFQPRLAIFLSGDVAFRRRFESKEDIYEGEDREQQKLRFFQVMFGEKQSRELKPIFDLRKQIFEEINRKGKIISPFGRPIFFSDDPENVVFRNYITTCEADFVYRAGVKIDQLLSEKKSRIVWFFYDAVMLLIHQEETELIKKIKNVVENDNIFNIRFPVKISQGKTFGDLKSLP